MIAQSVPNMDSLGVIAHDQNCRQSRLLMNFAKYAAYEVDGRNVRNFTDAFRLFPQLVLKVLLKHGLGKQEDDGKITVEAKDWYPLNRWLESFYEVADKIGAS